MVIAFEVSDKPSAVFLDRDGTLNVKAEEGCYVTSVRQLRLLAGAAGAVRKLNEAGTPVFVVTNQRGVALRRHVARRCRRGQPCAPGRACGAAGARVDAFMSARTRSGHAAAVSRYPACCGRPSATSRKCGLDRSVMIGDSETDIEAGLAASTLTIRLGPKGTQTRAAALFPDLLSSVSALLSPGGLLDLARNMKGGALA